MTDTMTFFALTVCLISTLIVAAFALRIAKYTKERVDALERRIERNHECQYEVNSDLMHNHARLLRTLDLREAPVQTQVYVRRAKCLEGCPGLLADPSTSQPRCCNHDSDCAVHNGDALPVGPCDCTALSDDQLHYMNIDRAQGLPKFENGPVHILYSDSINGCMVRRDDVWLALTTQLAQPKAAPSISPDDGEMLNFVLANGPPMERSGEYRCFGALPTAWYSSPREAIAAAIKGGA